ncbi:PaaI family thioesterase [Terricaulis silvestris]|uniref:Acyl-coenzyme A thioesterase THEM4 n=1 Tax=Terricaulis silvestris TaxID=2686094 RepID=A0A6I6MNC5_9CAUL|nr:PaaI family thioesterase [Terricaulis silvestris]QGZ96189.1 Acyl-coenzyme A thioesterase PaaI [Terricaulis silvestris]
MNDALPSKPPILPRAPGGEVILCAECIRRGGCRLGITKEGIIGEHRTETLLMCPKDHEGGAGVAHGGWTASVIDEALGHLPLLCGQMTVTAKLSVEFVRPVPIERPLKLVAWRERVERNRWINAGELTLVSTGVVLARAHGEFAMRDQTRHFEKFREWIAAEENGG